MSAPTFENLSAQRSSPAGAIVQPYKEGPYTVHIKSMLGPASYETGGVTLSAADCQLLFFVSVQIVGSVAGDRNVQVIYPDSKAPNKTVKLLITDLAGTEIANAVDLSTKKFRLRAMGW